MEAPTGVYWKRVLRAASGMSVLVLFAGCAAKPNSVINADAASQANAALEAREAASPASKIDPNFATKHREIWRDRPEYANLIGVKHVKEVRMLEAVAPVCPPGLGYLHAVVIVSFIVGPDGHVGDARVLSSSDSRFNASAIDAMKKFRFTPAQGVSGTEAAIYLQPFHFDGKAPGAT